MPYYKQTIDEVIVSKACAAEMPEGEGWELITGDPADVEVYTEPQPTPYNGNTLKSWALTEISEGRMSQDLLSHMSAFLDFANLASDENAAIFRAYAQVVGLSTEAETIIAKAIELGANISEGE